jgi:hypothetical protein
MASPLIDRPKLRKVDRAVLRRGDELLVVLRDPLGIAEPAALPEEANRRARHARRPAHRRAGPPVADAARRPQRDPRGGHRAGRRAELRGLPRRRPVQGDVGGGAPRLHGPGGPLAALRRRALPPHPAALRAELRRRCRIRAGAWSGVRRDRRAPAAPAARRPRHRRWPTRPCAASRTRGRSTRRDPRHRSSPGPPAVRADRQALRHADRTCPIGQRAWSARSSSGCRGSAARRSGTARR